AQSLPLLRHLDETLTMTVFGDARQARKWLAARPSTPLRASLAAFIERTYSLDDPRTAEEISAALSQLSAQDDGFETCETEIPRQMTALLAKSFGGKPVPPGTEFGSLTPEQQEVLRLIERVGADWWNVDNMMGAPLASYGFDFYEDAFQEFLAGERLSQ
ncbi:MAG TPA: hypothetical protein VHB77_10805, partial [Planctomycetaceae bacterium]|nr:hypothetical protein [Planctomycetaceae bacterium]